MPALAITEAGDADLGLIRAVAAGQAVSIGTGLLAAVQRRCEQARQALRDGRPVYGVNTGLGALSSVRLTEPQQVSHQRNLLLARATGGPPWLSPPEVRALITVRLLTFLSGDAAVSAGLCLRLADFLNYGIVPAVPRAGTAAAGEIIQLAHAFGPLAGIGQVLGPGGDLMPAREVLSSYGLTEFSLGPKEGIALIQGVPGVTGLSVLCLDEAAALTSLMERAAALSIVVARAPRDPYLAACGRGDDLLAAVLGRLRAAAGEEPSPRCLQAPVSFRVAGPVLAQVHRAAAQLEAAIRRALTGVTDSPAYLDGRFTSTAGFYGIDLSARCDQLTAALCHAAEVAAARLHRLMDPAVTGLPAQLAREPGPEAGLTPVHKRAAGEAHAARRLATATAVGLIETSGGQEDVQSFAWEAADKLRIALRHARAVTACELLGGYQAAALSGRPAPPGCRALLDWLAVIVGPIDGDRPFGTDIERLIQAPTPGH
jgi:histidine ammonia-lyase